MAAIKEVSKKVTEGWEKIRSNAILKLENYLNTGNS